MSHYLAIDVEATGENYINNFMPCFGACIVDVKEQKVVDKFLVYFKNSNQKEKSWDKRCLKEFWLKEENKTIYKDMLQKMENEGISEQIGMSNFIKWVLKNSKKCEKLVVITDTGGFDVGWLNYYLSRYITEYDTSMNYITGKYQPIRDMSSFYMGIGKCTPNMSLWGSEKMALKGLGIKKLPKFEVEHDHNPQNDAITIGLTAAFFANHLELV